MVNAAKDGDVNKTEARLGAFAGRAPDPEDRGRETGTRSCRTAYNAHSRFLSSL